MKRHYLLDRYAALLITRLAGNPDDWLSIYELADPLGISVPWLRLSRRQDWGPPSELVNGRVMYQRGRVIAWLKQRDAIWQARNGSKVKRAA